ncbi:hypothetical protein C1X59_23690 [Pseudomonas sp. FW215-R2]|nr:hypothetical protein C1X59_23690 [Pseudomonas sp. FW215-R2]PMX07091.1 hypothetical protein C1X60_22470 [Pseudomonas sp. FW215-L1]PMX20144.1 hypothetical protein C1X57_22235 [Pseudomonas sp. FW215-E1]PNA26045.1 hypothetical protein C1X58_21255 [Pseudomonas sp. FW215-R4]
MIALPVPSVRSRADSNRLFENVASEGKTRQKQAWKRSLRVVNEHSEPVFNAGLPSAVVFKQPERSDRNAVP